jgi:hypothetical protein
MWTAHPSVQPKANISASKFTSHRKPPCPSSSDSFFVQTMHLGTIRRFLRTVPCAYTFWFLRRTKTAGDVYKLSMSAVRYDPKKSGTSPSQVCSTSTSLRCCRSCPLIDLGQNCHCCSLYSPSPLSSHTQRLQHTTKGKNGSETSHNS